MKNLHHLKKLTLWGLCLFTYPLFAQTDLQALLSYPFDSDSLYGFNEEAAIQEGLTQHQLIGRELKMFVAYKKRKFIIKKYGLLQEPKYNPIDYSPWSNKTANLQQVQTAACNNEDFELGNYNGWIYTTWSNYLADNCLMTSNSSGGGGPVLVVSTPYNFPGGCVYSWPAALNVIPNSPLGGNYVAQLNNCSANSKVVRLEKTFTVTPSNALFQFAYIMALDARGGHCCCEQPQLRVDFMISNNCTGAPTLTNCPSFTISAPQGPSCSPCPPTFTLTSSGNIYYSWDPVNSTPWKVQSVDLTPLIGSCVTVRFTVTDCIYGGHYATAFIDTKCSPMDIIGNGNTFPAGTPSIVLPTCGSNNATITAPPGLGPYTWQGPPGFPTQTVQTVTTNITGNYTLTMNPPGSCSPITKIITVTITPSPAIQSTFTQPSCNNPSATASATTSSGTGTYAVTWSPTPASSATVSANTFSASGLVPGTNTVTVTDAIGCTASNTFVINAAPPIPTFSISLSDDTLTCTQPTVSATAVNTNTNVSSPSYTFTSVMSGTFAGNPYTVSMPGTYTVWASDPSTGCIYTNTFAVGIYTTVPTVTVSPNSLNIPCNGSAGTFTGTSNPTVNISYSWLQPGGAPISGNLLTPGNAGTYTFVATNIANGCSNTFTVSVTQSTAAPTMTVTATNNNYNIKCVPNTVTLTVNASQAGGGGVPQVYWTDATGTNTISTANTVTFNTPGNYVCVVYDPTPGGCSISQTITIGVDTLSPAGGYTLNVPTNTLTCKYPSAVLTGTSPVNGATYVWYTSSGAVPNQTLTVNSTTNISQTTVDTYTVEITDPNNGCKRKVPVTIYQDKQPLGLTAQATPTTLTCKDLQTTLQFTSNPITEPLTFTWTTPPPTFTNSNNNPITFYSSGTYTLCATRSSNGCVSCTTVQVGSNTTPPSTVAVGPYTIACGYTNTTIYAGTTSTTNVTYIWDGPPSATITPINGYSPTVTNAGTYIVVITNTTTGCASQNQITVVNGTIDANFTPNPSTGFAPLNVSFTNNSSYGNPNILTYYWSFGNGTTVTAVANDSVPTPGAYTTYSAPGTYTVIMVMENGPCVDTAMQIIRVDIPSNLEIPNIFTPNGDGVNDYFILHTTNLTEIETTIIDRWGVKVYEVKTDKGNIQWDGKTMSGKEAPTGTYFYIIKAKGLDEKAYEQKGFITLLR